MTTDPHAITMIHAEEKSLNTVIVDMSQKKKTKNLNLLIIVLEIIAVGSLTALLVFAIRYRNSRQTYEELKNDVTTIVEPAPESSPVEAKTDTESSQEETAEEGALDPSLKEIGVMVDWKALQKINHYVVGWLYAPDIDLSYPLVQYKDNEYFLNINFYRHKDESGTLFFDYRNSLEDGLENWILYGHRRNDRSMFGNLKRYGKEDYYKKHPVMYLLTPGRNYRIELFSCRTVHASDKYFTLFFSSPEDMEKYIEKAKEQSYWESVYDEGTEYSIITMSTCTTYGEDDDNRLLLSGWLVPLN